MIERKLIIVACVAGTFFASCTPYPENVRKPNPPQSPNATTPGTVSDLKQQQLKEERAKAQKEAERKAAEEQAKLAGNGGTVTPPGPAGDPAKPEYEYGTPVPGKDGFVLSPYNGKIIDVRDIPSGTLVQDPTYPASEKKYFRVP